MTKPWTIRRWQPNLGDAQALCDIMVDAYPLQPSAPPEETLVRTNALINGIEEAALLAFEGARPVGVAHLSILRNPEVASLTLGVRSGSQGRGLGQRLFKHALDHARNRSCRQVRTHWFYSSPRAVAFASLNGFVHKDTILWSRFDTSHSISAWALQKEQSALCTGIRVVRGTDFESIRSDWDIIWWRHLMDAMHDVPMDIPFVELPFETWRPFIEPPLMDRSRVLVALDDTTMAGLMYVGPSRQNQVNIDHTSVARSYRRRGISTALKCAAIRLAKSMNADSVSTQNHQNNPMFELNQCFGFQHLDSVAEGLKSLTV